MKRLFIKTKAKLNSTLFPYTTLFRSRSASSMKYNTLIIKQIGVGLRSTDWLSERSCKILHILGHHSPLFNLDRKSTRLNSSHVEISYAVFCLKKKNIYTNTLSISIII